MILDGHIHLTEKEGEVDDFKKRLEKAGLGGGIVLSPAPASFESRNHSLSPEERMEKVLTWTEDSSNLYAFFWVDPLDPGAREQVEMAEEMGADGIKVICNNFYPGDAKPMKIWKEVAAKKLPLLFHSGISYAGTNSSKYHRPAEFEALFTIDGIKFCLAHISWPWCDECLAVYGKYINVIKGRKNKDIEMYIDITRGTPPIYRKEALYKIYNIGYDIEDNIIFGTDNRANNYDYERTLNMIEKDNEIYEELGLESKVINKIYEDNLKRFVQN
ncbi:MAG: amidohydrolase family protein [Bacillota bacterium]